MNRWKYILLFGIVCIGFLIRIVRLDSIPSGFHADEAAFGYNAYSLLKTGKDEYGKTFPLVLRSFNDYKGAVYAYVTIPFIALFGMNEWSVRFPSLLSGIGILLLSFFIVRRLTKRDSIAFFSSGLIAVSPIFVTLSRVQSDPLLSMFFVLLGLHFFLLWIDRKTLGVLFLTTLSWMIGISTYYSPWLFLFSFLIFLFWYFRKEIRGVQKIYAFVLYVVLVGFAWFLLTSFMATRYGQVSVFQKPDVKALIEEGVREDTNQEVKPIFARVFHNKILDYGRYLTFNYSRFLSFDFLFYQASEPAREKIPNSGVFFMFDLPFFVYGVYFIVKKRVRWGGIFLLWFFLVPVLSVFATDETPNIHRFVLSGIPETVIVSLGGIELFRIIRNKLFRTIFIIGVGGAYLGSCVFFIHELFIHQPVHFPFYRDYAYKGLVDEIKKRFDAYDQFVVTQDKGNAYIHFLFHLQYDPVAYLRSGSTGNEPFGRFDKFIFIPMKCPTEKDVAESGKVPMDRSMLIVKGGKCPENENERIIGTILWADGSEAFQLVEFGVAFPTLREAKN